MTPALSLGFVMMMLSVVTFIATQLTSRHRSRADYLQDQIKFLTEQVEAKSDQVRTMSHDIERLTNENIMLMRKLARMPLKDLVAGKRDVLGGRGFFEQFVPK